MCVNLILSIWIRLLFLLVWDNTDCVLYSYDLGWVRIPFFVLFSDLFHIVLLFLDTRISSFNEIVQWGAKWKRNCEYIFLVLMLKLSVNVCGMIMFHYLLVFFLQKKIIKNTTCVCLCSRERVCVRERKRKNQFSTWILGFNIHHFCLFFPSSEYISVFFCYTWNNIYIYIERERERESSEFYGYCFLRYTECKATCYFVQKTNLTRLYMNALTRCRWRTQIIYMWFYVSLDHRIWNHWFCAEL